MEAIVFVLAAGRPMWADASPRGFGLRAVVVAAAPERATIRLDGQIDLATADLVSGLVADQLARGRCELCLDLATVSFADCAALRAFVDADHRCLAAGGHLGNR
jgi:anti-anti-sigma factor